MSPLKNRTPKNLQLPILGIQFLNSGKDYIHTLYCLDPEQKPLSLILKEGNSEITVLKGGLLVRKFRDLSINVHPIHEDAIHM